MADEEGMESFEINDYDLNSALNPGRRPRFTKEQQIYGMWADKDSDEEEEFGRRGFGGSKKKKDYSAPVNFISGGVKVGDKITEKQEGEGNSDEDRQAPSDPLRIPAFKSQRSGFGGSKLQRKQQKNVPIVNEAEFAGLRGTGGKTVQTGKDFGDWEKHTKGIGTKLLEKMGYKKGKGLGKEGQGIAKPVEAKLRPGRGAVGAYGAEAKGPKIPRRDGTVVPDEVDEEEEEEEIAEGKRASGQWRKEGGRRRPKYKYRTIDEVIADGGALGKRIMAGGEHSSTKVIDMTGKEQKVYSGYNALATKKREPEDEVKGVRKFDVPELTYNLDLLVEITEEEIIRNNRQLTFLKDQNVALRHEIGGLKASVVNENEQQDRVADVLALVETFAEKGRMDELSLEDCSKLFEQLQRDYYQEYKLFGLSDIATTNVLPLIRNAFDGWEPLSDPDHCISLMSEWRQILEDPTCRGRGSTSTPSDQMDPYHKLVWELWMPAVRRAALKWKPRECEPMLRLVETWMGQLPNWILENLLEQIILPKIQSEVEDWDPLTDTVPLHSWLHPWLSLMGDRLQPVYPPIRYKLGRALTQWHPRDPSAKNILKPWKEVFSQGSMDSFLSQNIIPKLELCLSAFIVNPADQRLEAWKWIMDWMDMISPQMIAQLLLRHLFPKWHEALFTWLSCVNPNYAEISEWYSGWKAMFSQELLDIPMIKDQFDHALAMMNRAVSGGGVHRPPLPPPPATQKASFSQHKKDMEFLAAAKSAQSGVPANFKDLLEKRAADNGITFLPVPNKSREGKPVFKFGSELIYVERNVVFIQKEAGHWEPIGLDQLISLALEEESK